MRPSAIGKQNRNQRDAKRTNEIAAVQNLFTVLKLAALALLIVAGLSAPLRPPVAPGLSHDASISVRSLGVALIPVLFAYGGWAHANNVGGELRDGDRTLPRAIVLGVSCVVIVYLLANIAYLHALGVEGLARSTAPASDVLRHAFGPAGSTLISLGIVVSTLGFVGVAIMSAPRILQAMAADGLVLPSAAALHPRFHTPHIALLVQGGWAVVLTLSGTYGQLLDYVVFGDWIFFGLIAATLFRFRARDRREPGHDSARRTYRAPFYPVLPALFVITCGYVVVSSV